VVWNRRNKLQVIPVVQDWLGLTVIVGAMGILAVGVLGAENFLSRISLVLLLAGLIIQFRGWAFFRELLFPWVVLFLMIPLPAIVFNEIALPLQFLASRLATFMLSFAGVPVLREGNIIHLPSLSLDVAEACSGLRSLVSLVAVGVFYGYFHESRSRRRVLLVLGSIPIAIVSNSIRIMGSGLVGEYWNPEKAEGFFHTLSGILIFSISLVLLVSLHAALGWTDRFARSWRAAG
jgi:exosortase